MNICLFGAYYLFVAESTQTENNISIELSGNYCTVQGFPYYTALKLSEAVKTFYENYVNAPICVSMSTTKKLFGCINFLLLSH